jgi:hypothetical protein
MEPLSFSQPYFSVGDRVRLLDRHAVIPAGTVGTVVHHFLDTRLYDVQFDGYPVLQVVDQRKLAPAPPDPSSP